MRIATLIAVALLVLATGALAKEAYDYPVVDLNMDRRFAVSVWPEFANNGILANGLRACQGRWRPGEPGRRDGVPPPPAALGGWTR